MSGVTLERHADTLVAAKRSDCASRLSNEAELLSRLRHPGVVEFVSLVDGETPMLLTVWAGTDTWDRRLPTDTPNAVHALASIAATVDDLHSSGATHRSLSPDHVIVANDGRPVLCGLGHAGPVDQAGLDADRIGLQRLVECVAESADSRYAGRLAELSTLLDDPHLELHDFIRVAESLVEQQPTRSPKTSPHVGVPFAAALVVAVVAAVGISARPDRVPTAVPSRPPLTSTEPTPAPPPATSTEPTPAPPPATAPPSSTSAINTRQTTETTSLVTTPGDLVIEHAGRRYGLGAAGDLAIVGDWNCDGVRTPALLQRSTGIVAVFDSWPEAGRRLRPRFTVITPDAESIIADLIDGCEVVRARGPYGSTIITEESS